MDLKSRDEVIRILEDLGSELKLTISNKFYSIEDKILSIRPIKHWVVPRQYKKELERLGFPESDNPKVGYAGDLISFLQRYENEPELHQKLLQIRKEYFDSLH